RRRRHGVGPAARLPDDERARLRRVARLPGVVHRQGSGGRPVARRVALLAALATIAFALFGPLDDRGREGSLVAHLSQHLLLGDVAAPLLWLGVAASRRGRLAAGLRSPVFAPAAALAIWAVGVTAWYLPPVHRAAADAGFVHVLDHVAFLGLGLLGWLA